MKEYKAVLIKQFEYLCEIVDDVINHGKSKEIQDYVNRKWATLESPLTGEMDEGIRICYDCTWIYLFDDKGIFYEIDPNEEWGGELLKESNCSQEEFIEKIKEMETDFFDSSDEFPPVVPRKYVPYNEQ